MNSSHTYNTCSLLNNSLTITTHAHIKPCCRFGYSKNGPHVDNMGVDNILLSETWKEYREKMKTDSLSQCSICYYAEENHNTSLRMTMNESNSYLGQEIDKIEGKLELLEVNISNLCNLQCRSCGPTCSTSWFDDAKLIDATIPFKLSQLNEYESKKIEFIKQLDLSNLKILKLLGGETFYPNALLRMFSMLDQKIKFENVSLLIYTNCTFFPLDEIIDKLLTFVKICLRLSLDATKELNDYIRSGSNWSTIEKVADRWIELAKHNHNLDVGVACTESILNTSNMNELESWTTKKQISLMKNKLIQPSFLRHDLFENGTEADKEKFKTVMKFLDKKYDITLEKINPMLWKFIYELEN